MAKFYERFADTKHNGNFYTASITKEELLSKDISSIVNTLKLARNNEKDLSSDIPVTKNIKADKKLQGGLLLQFKGYESDPREMFEVPETKLFFEKLLEEVPNIIYFLENTMIILLLSCFFSERAIYHRPMLDIDKIDDFFKLIIPGFDQWIQNKFHRDEFKERINNLMKKLSEI